MSFQSASACSGVLVHPNLQAEELADAAAAALYSRMLERFQHQGADLSRLVKLIGEQRLDKETVSTALDRLGASNKAAQEKIGDLKGELMKLGGGS